MTTVEGAVTFCDVMARLGAAVNVATAAGDAALQRQRWSLKGALVSFDCTIVNVARSHHAQRFPVPCGGYRNEEPGDRLVYFDQKCHPLRHYSPADNASLDPGSSAY
jgi:hypothetical protein